MPYKCEVCKKEFSRCAYIQHRAQSSYCNNSNPKNVEEKLVSRKVDYEIPSESPPKNKKTEGPSVELLENGSLFMVVSLGQNENPRVADSKNSDEKHVGLAAEKKETTEENLDDSNLLPLVTDVEGNAIEVVIDLPHGVDVLLPLEEENEHTIHDPIEGLDSLSMEVDPHLINLPETPRNSFPNPTAEALPQSSNQVDALKGLTKQGVPRKRAPPRGKDEIKTKRQKNKDKHDIQPPCNDTCKRKCSEKISQDRRQVIHQEFWELEVNERKIFILGHVSKSIVGRKTTEEESRRGKTFNYTLSTAMGEKKIVCKTFFLGTLGYKKKNDMFVFNTLNQAKEGISPKPDMRGRHTSHKSVDRDLIKSHILKYNPCISHYRREHAPNRKYLSSELTIAQMYSDFRKENSEFPCSYDLYRSVICDMNISFTKLGHEECERCTRFKVHNADHVKNIDQSCLVCKEWGLHHEKYTEARKMYEKFANLDTEEYNQSGTVVYSMDLQKVMMLPQMEQFKEVVFTRRIVVFNESFVPVGKKQKIEPIACLWHEGISGRKKQDITSAFQSFLEMNRDAEKIVVWLDNCSSQNKNWALFSHLVGAVNSNELKAISIELNFLEPGHTFMSADYFHHQVTQQVKSKGKVYDFADFEDCVKKSCSGKVKVKSLQPTDFFMPFDFSSTHKISKKTPRPYLNEMVQVVFKRGSLDLHYKTKFAGESYQLSFLKSGYLKKKAVPQPERRKAERGVNHIKKAEIIAKLIPLMPQNRHAFWLGLSASEEPDLITDIDD